MKGPSHQRQVHAPHAGAGGTVLTQRIAPRVQEGHPGGGPGGRRLPTSAAAVPPQGTQCHSRAQPAGRGMPVPERRSWLLLSRSHSCRGAQTMSQIGNGQTVLPRWQHKACTRTRAPDERGMQVVPPARSAPGIQETKPEFHGEIGAD